MISLIKGREITFEQTFSVRKIVMVRDVQRYTDGHSFYIQLSLYNSFHQKASFFKLELSQFNDQKQLLKKEVVAIPSIQLQSRTIQSIDDFIPILEETNHLSLYISEIHFQSIELKNGAWIDGFEKDEMPFQRNKKNKPILIISTTRTSPWILKFALLLVFITIILTTAFFQYGLF